MVGVLGSSSKLGGSNPPTPGFFVDMKKRKEKSVVQFTVRRGHFTRVWRALYGSSRAFYAGVAGTLRFVAGTLR